MASDKPEGPDSQHHYQLPAAAEQRHHEPHRSSSVPHRDEVYGTQIKIFNSRRMSTSTANPYHRGEEAYYDWEHHRLAAKIEVQRGRVVQAHKDLAQQEALLDRAKADLKSLEMELQDNDIKHRDQRNGGATVLTDAPAKKAKRSAHDDDRDSGDKKGVREDPQALRGILSLPLHLSLYVTVGMLKLFCTIVLCALVARANAIGKRDTTFTWGIDKLRGVNIGGWLILEPFITPSIFERFPSEAGIVDEYTLCQHLGPQVARDTVLAPHWEAWVSRADFERIAGAGFNFVRVPVPFWAFDAFDTPYATGAAPYLDKAISWARDTGLKVLVDLHTAPRSQNGYDNSGQRMDTPGWGEGESVGQMLSVLHTVAAKYASAEFRDVVLGIELLNEPAGYTLDMNMVRQFYRNGWGEVREFGDTVVILQDAFNDAASFNGWMTPADGGVQGVAIDHHEYQVFELDMVKWSHEQHRRGVCDRAWKWEGADKWTFVGEWSAAMTDCAKWLNGYLRGARYDGTYLTTDYIGDCTQYNNISSWNQELRDATRAYVEAQINTFEAGTQGWVFWNFKTESAAEWDLFALLNAGLFPNAVAERQFKRVC
ncbi:glycoside hydrolase family 5 protein [Aplosporella prunicola CBS 121167]|uniref:Glycoside hydrolase family 5 protein n=1 Tax=Aplosporella prunicola CBS 121167 TaxID=1176127 RepID=A0A6A6B6M9_9PEZI|nr:glycoside hydrolase family 5 protein [Aplosporella prunicola CBS 121167]KAF2139792.1 glycoside hydrolase family 5 protein [Aplosporella prunicola CBS 121167]